MKKLRLVIPKGRIYSKIAGLLSEAGIHLELDERAYRPIVSASDLEVKVMKPQNIPKLLELGSHDVGFTGFDWIRETSSDVAELMDLGFDPVRIVAAIPNNSSLNDLRKRPIVVASEYENLASGWLTENKFDFVLLRTYGATEVFPPDDADMIIDNTSTGRTLLEHDLKIVDTVLKSSTAFVANKSVLDDEWKKEKIDTLMMLFKSILDARGRVMLEMNVGSDNLEAVINILPAMRSPTIATLFGNAGHAVKVVVQKQEAVELIPRLKKMGASDILESEFRKVVI